MTFQSAVTTRFEVVSVFIKATALTGLSGAPSGLTQT